MTNHTALFYIGGALLAPCIILLISGIVALVLHAIQCFKYEDYEKLIPIVIILSCIAALIGIICIGIS